MGMKIFAMTSTRYFIPVTIEKSTCDIFSATIGTLFLCCVRVFTKIQERCCCLCFVILTQRDMCKSRTLQHIHNMRREKRKKNGKIGESSKVERMCSTQCVDPKTQNGHLFLTHAKSTFLRP